MYGLGKVNARQQAQQDARQARALEKQAIDDQIRLTKAQTAADVKLQKAGVQYLPAAATAAATAADSDSIGKFVKALPWVLGGAVVLGGLYFILRKKGGSQ